MQNSRHRPALGALVDVRGRRWRLIETRRFERCTLVTLQGLERADAGQTLRLLTPFDRIGTVPRTRCARVAGRIAVAQRVADAVLASHPWLACWTAATANLMLLPWQLEPALAMLGGATRVLLADAVGLGKTVQAGLILSELFAHGLVDRALVLTPAGLRAQWADELEARFALRATVLDQAALAREAASLPPDVSPWATSSIVISSIDLVKRPEVLTAVDRVPFDLLIVDEAHHATPGSDRGALVERIGRRTSWVVAISATPHSGDDRAFDYLANLGGGGSGTLRIFRRTSPATERRIRSKLVAVRTAAAELALLDGVQEYAMAIWRERGAPSSSARLLATILARRAASSPEAILTTLARRRLLLDADQTAAMPDQASLPWEESDEEDADVADSLLMGPGLARADEERRWIDRLIELATAARHSGAKASWIERWLTRTRESVIVFSEYRDTIEALRSRFEPLTSVVALHGGLSPAARQAATAAFVDGSARLLLATDTGGEGLNLHARCRTVINNELPWNPARLDQRVGRVDRIGQRRTVHAVHLLHAGSVEQTVLAHLYRRVVRAATAVIPGGRDFEAQVAETVLSGASMPSLALIEWPHAPVPEAIAEASRLERLRRLVRLKELHPLAAAGSARTIAVAAARRHGRAAHLLCAFQLTIAGAGGRTLASSVVPISLALVPSFPLRRREQMVAVQRLSESTAIRDVLAAESEGLLQSADAAGRALARAMNDRLGVLRAASPPDGHRLYQPALFDRRAARLAAERAAVHEIHRAHLDRVEELMRGFRQAHVQQPVLIGAWLVEA